MKKERKLTLESGPADEGEEAAVLIPINEPPRKNVEGREVSTLLIPVVQVAGFSRSLSWASRVLASTGTAGWTSPIFTQANEEGLELRDMLLKFKSSSSTSYQTPEGEKEVR